LTVLLVAVLNMRHALEDLDMRILPYTSNHAFFLFDLPLRHADPFDRQIIAQALCEEIPVMTCDEKFSLYNGLKVLW
jgi:PIN domain nuclease of toxin-antitoxin system